MFVSISSGLESNKKEKKILDEAKWRKKVPNEARWRKKIPDEARWRWALNSERRGRRWLAISVWSAASSSNMATSA